MEGRFGRLLNWIVLIGGVAAILYPAIIDPHLSTTQILISLFEWQWSLGFAMRWLCVALIIGSIYILVTNKIYRNIPISVIWTKLIVHFDTVDGSRVRIAREQALRANQPNVTAYFMTARPTTQTGRMPEDGISGNVFCGDTDYNDRLDLHGDERRGFEIIHLFGQSLPYAWYMPLIPIWLLNRDPQRLFWFLKNKVVVRRISTTYEDEHNIPRPSMSFSATIYPQHNFEISMRCPAGHLLTNIQAMRIKNNGIVDVRARQQTDGTFVLFIDRLQNETLRV